MSRSKSKYHVKEVLKKRIGSTKEELTDLVIKHPYTLDAFREEILVLIDATINHLLKNREFLEIPMTNERTVLFDPKAPSILYGAGQKSSNSQYIDYERQMLKKLTLEQFGYLSLFTEAEQNSKGYIIEDSDKSRRDSWNRSNRQRRDISNTCFDLRNLDGSDSNKRTDGHQSDENETPKNEREGAFKVGKLSTAHPEDALIEYIDYKNKPAKKKNTKKR